MQKLAEYMEILGFPLKINGFPLKIKVFDENRGWAARWGHM